MIKHGQPMSQALAQMQVNELKMNDPKLNKIFDKLKKGDKVKLKTSSTISKGNDFVEYLVKSKNIVNKGRVEKITLATVGNEKAVKKFLYKRDGAVTFAIGDMGASIDDIKEKYSIINHEIIEEIEVEELDEGKKRYNTTSNVGKAKYVINFHDGKKTNKDGSDFFDIKIFKNKPDFENAEKELKSKGYVKEEVELIEGAASDARRGMSKDRDLSTRGRDSADVDDNASDADKKSAMKNMVMQMRQALDVRGNKPIEFEDGKKQKVDSKILNMLLKAHGMIPKPRDKEKFVTMISKSYRDMLKVAKMVGKQLRMGEEVELDEGKMKDLLIKAQDLMGPSKNREQGIEFVMKGLKVSEKEATKLVDAVLKMNMGEEVELDEKKDAGKSASGYDIFHKDFSSAMQHATAFAKKKGQPIKKDEIDSKVATGPKKPSKGKENSYNLETEKGKSWSIQVYNMDGKKYELNMYLTSSYVPEELTNEENEMVKSLKDTIVEMWSEAVSPAQQAAIAISKKEKEEQDEGNAFGAALQAAREKGDETFVVAGKTYKCEDYNEDGEVKEFVQSDGIKRRVKEGDNRLKSNKTETNKNSKSDDGDGMDAVQPKAVKKKFKDRKDKDIDNDGDVDDSDKFLHKRRKAVSKAINSQKESIERYHETKKGSLRDSILQMWGENVEEGFSPKEIKMAIGIASDKRYAGGNMSGAVDAIEKIKKGLSDHKQVAAVLKRQNEDLTNEKKDGIKGSMTDTGKEVTKVEVDSKMPKIKNEKNKV